ncbi:hypothetical protein BKA62DRAFT_770347 [Auriculariales sp. MPI-PUGE-AT-0066]|nr:hypothetical protein BKA62DRAFT_770347 [Auriculariales sp. MPI-PUGE-AT-0066]
MSSVMNDTTWMDEFSSAGNGYASETTIECTGANLVDEPTDGGPFQQSGKTEVAEVNLAVDDIGQEDGSYSDDTACGELQAPERPQTQTEQDPGAAQAAWPGWDPERYLATYGAHGYQVPAYEFGLAYYSMASNQYYITTNSEKAIHRAARARAPSPEVGSILRTSSPTPPPPSLDHEYRSATDLAAVTEVADGHKPVSDPSFKATPANVSHHKTWRPPVSNNDQAETSAAAARRGQFEAQRRAVLAASGYDPKAPPSSPYPFERVKILPGRASYRKWKEERDKQLKAWEEAMLVAAQRLTLQGVSNESRKRYATCDDDVNDDVRANAKRARISRESGALSVQPETQQAEGVAAMPNRKRRASHGEEEEAAGTATKRARTSDSSDPAPLG